MTPKNIFTIIFFCLLCGCSTTTDPSHSNVETPALHALQDQELRTLMDRMSGLMFERFMTEHEMDVERRKYARQIIDAALILNSSSEALVKRAPFLGMNAEENNAFVILAQKLGHHAERLKNQAENNSFNGISSTLHEMQATCLACHTLFRKI